MGPSPLSSDVPAATIKLGKAEIRSALEMTLTGRPIAWLGADPALIEANRSWMEPHFLEDGDTWSLNFRSWILQVDGKVVVVDPCTGNGRPHPMPPFDGLDTPFIERFCETGVRPEDVTHVFCTHMHHDHCGWNTQLRGGRYVPTFPNARYLFVRREYERWNPNGADYKAVDYNEGVYERSILPVVEAGLADLVMDRHRVSPSLEIQPAQGHTLGHAMLHVASQDEEGYFAGDVLHHPLQLIRPEIQFGDCDDLDQAIETRRRLVAQALERDALIIPAHLPFPHAGRLRRQGDVVSFEALRL
ncbi:MBL fold metallo-hydrolase [Phenylobacterium sp. LjRoot225]|uniref:MBL fold metallo-hydrolase n=1 Tax=Phenylobacterium sp. LjRoot225 TaxID=3342285 RepID=UPI003ECC8B21